MIEYVYLELVEVWDSEDRIEKKSVKKKIDWEDW